MTEAPDNPFASPPIEHEDTAAAPLLDGDKIGRWLLLPLASGTFNGAAIVAISGMSIAAGIHAYRGYLVDMLSVQEGRMMLGMQLLVLAVYGAICGGLSGILLGGVAFSLRRNVRQRSLIYLTGFLFSILFFVGAATAGVLTLGSGSLLDVGIVATFLFVCSLLFAWRMNANIRKYLLSRADDESAGEV
ncbi:hypothetical protein [Blastopirellula marina]|uniref:Uncharacterized protein n=1 Tax=Blastopirellula marina TaxID=124 RepID=A0A2S8F3Z7_9BACT|nr:hypothetical protein [Blastopirellula marina]PQO26863.1 hypothetical protein C5Y98_29265 [Blastopirellula marina]PQO41551.1 hypothetical protein C5Y93_31060 [Blastopirellula marina]PTL41070.1 hypothetical protein C5Y97_29280 [Blastopirellula marina]